MNRLAKLYLIPGSLLMISFNSSAEELNVRMLPNKLNNEVTHMRLQALLVKDKAGSKQDPLGSQKNYGSVFSDDCNMNIGNSTTGQGLLSKPQTIIITGSVVNKCR